MLRIGLIADTHNLLRPEAEAFLQGCDRIIHAGDICDAKILDKLNLIAPVTAVRGNNDKGAWAEQLAETERMQLDERCIYIIHDVAQLELDTLTTDVKVVIFGHSHKPSIENRNGVLFVNPGSAGPRRFSLPVSVGELIVENGLISARTVQLKI
ncbi:MAG: metallophosphoesterase family protein [Steroidobacteraceae bacterium]